MEDRQVSLKAAIDALTEHAKWMQERYHETCSLPGMINALEELPSAQPQYEELTPEEAASEIASGSIMPARYWLDVTIRLKQMGYAICRKR